MNIYNGPSSDPVAHRTFGLWLAVGIALVISISLPLAFFFIPRYLVSPSGLTKVERLKAENDVRTSAVQALGGLIVLLGGGAGAYLTWNQLRMSREQVRFSMAATRQELELTRTGQITDRFIRAIDQLGSEQLDIRIGGIYALERIALNSGRDHGPVMEVLVAFIRSHANTVDYSESREPSERRVRRDEPASQLTNVARTTGPVLRADLQAALTVIGRRRVSADTSHLRLDFSELDLTEADLSLMHLDRAVFVGSRLTRANLNGASLQRADLWEAQLKGVQAVDTNFRGAYLRGARLQGAMLQGTIFEECDLRGAHLEGSFLWETHFERANLRAAHLKGSEWKNVYLEGCRLTEKSLEDSIAVSPIRIDVANVEPEGSPLTD
jgi:uncharacterized protein YjbI with pentapeptide repeats